MKPKSVNIGVDILWHGTFVWDIFDGIADFAALDPSWVVRSINANIMRDPTWQLNGLIFSEPTQMRARPAGYTGPIVAVGVEPFPSDVLVSADDEQVGRLAAQHLLERGFRELAFVGETANRPDRPGPYDASTRREAGFIQEARKQGCATNSAACPTPHWSLRDPFVRWLIKLPKPAGIFCWNDHLARDVCSLAAFAGINVPGEIAIIGADNDFWTRVSSPTLSTVAVPWRKIGYAAAEWVDRLLHGESPPPARHVAVAAQSVMTRQSTDVLAIPDPDVAKAIISLQHHACDGLQVKQLLRQIPIDRRRLERNMRKYLGRTPHEEIRRVQIERAKTLLTENDIPIMSIPKSVGIPSKGFSVIFRRAVGMTPTQYRRKGESTRPNHAKLSE